jgi:hypothetical protein
MNRSILIGSIAAGLMAAAASSPAWAQAATHPDGTDCSAINNSSSREECVSQQNESRQHQMDDVTGPSTGPSTAQPDAAPSAATPGVPGSGAPGAGTQNNGVDQNYNGAPAGTSNPNGASTQ